jgi:hypothetical protein
VTERDGRGERPRAGEGAGGHDAEQVDRQADHHREERGRVRISCECSEQDAERPERGAREEHAQHEQRQALPRLATGDAADLDDAPKPTTSTNPTAAPQGGDEQHLPSMGWFALCKDIEGNEFGLWQHDTSAQGGLSGTRSRKGGRRRDQGWASR